MWALIPHILFASSILLQYSSLGYLSTKYVKYNRMVGMCRSYQVIRCAMNDENFAHEFQNSIQSIRNSTQLFSKEWKDRSKRKEMLTVFKQEANVIVNGLARNTQEGEFGKRGEDLIATSFILLLCTFVGVHPFISFIIQLLGCTGFASGSIAIVLSIIALREQVSPFLTPVRNQTLVTSGIYRFVRHPMYGGLLLLCTGWAAALRSAEKVVFAIALGFVLVRFATIYLNYPFQCMLNGACGSLSFTG